MDNQVHNQIVSFIWGIADDCLRDIYVRGKYRDVILPMTVIRRLDALLEDTKPAVLEMKETLVVNSLPFVDYMDGFPDEKNGLWGVVQELLGRKVDIPDLREKYKDVKRAIVRE